jgi:serine phosphatase RsbU (regulator of sigma subunit)/anti-sigma regulatory factor (Ser/Thr protein kinase)
MTTTSVALISGDGREVSGLTLWAVRAIWSAIVVASLLVAIAGFDVFLGGDRALIDNQGPLSVQPELARELEFRLFDVDVIKSVQTGMHLLGMTLFAGAAVLIFWRRSRDWVVALSSATLMLAGIALFAPSKLLAAQRPAWESVVSVLGVFDAGPAFWRSMAGVAILLFALIFPDGRFTPNWTRWLAAGFLLEVALWTAFPGVGVFAVDRWPEALVPAWTLGLALVAIYAQLYRYIWKSGPETRKQTRLVMISLTAIVGSFLLIWLLDPDLSSSVDLGLVLVTERTQAIYDMNVLSLLTVGVILFPISIGVSVARYRLWDMDLIINRALVYGTLTGIIGAVLLGAVIVVGGAVENTFGRGIGIGIGALLMAALFQPLRVRVQAGIDRRFYPQKYDAERTLDALAERLRDEVDLEVLRNEIQDSVIKTLRPAATRLALPAVDASYEADHRFLSGVYLTEANRPIASGSEILPADASTGFSFRGIEVVVPLVSHNELTGVLELGRRDDGTDYSALDLQLLRRLADQSAPVIRYAELVAREAEERAARQSYEHELQLAEKIQRDLLPRQLPELDGWELGARYEPARQVGGDLYDFIALPDGRLGIVIADVTDKGVPAAMVMATCRSVLRAAATGTDRPTPGDVLGRVNSLLLPDIPDNMFVTCFYAILDPATGRVSFANAGQNLPLMRSGNHVTELMARGMPLGLMPDMAYEENEAVVGPGDSLLFYSDGLVEAHNPDGEMFGKARAIDRVRNHPGGPSILDYLVESLIGFAGVEGAKDDDVTLVAIKRLDGRRTGPEVSRVITEFSVPSVQGGELEAVDRVESSVVDLNLPIRVMERLKTAVAEATMNAMEHGNGYDPNLPVEIRVLSSTTSLEVHVTDQGQAPSTLDVEEPDIAAKLAGDQSPRGWGIFLIKNMVDDLRVTDADGKHRLELVVNRREDQ